MIEIVLATSDDWRRLRAIRLSALGESPDAFGSSYEREVAFDEATWRARAGSGSRFLAVDGDRVVGTAAGYTEPGGPHELVGMWVDPAHRGHRIADRLIDAVVTWARAHGARELRLDVSVGNESARAAYLRAGFLPTGIRTPMPRDPGIVEESMALPLELPRQV